MKKLTLATLALALVFPAAASAQTYTFLDNFGFCWTLTVVEQIGKTVYFEGTSDRGGGDVWSATATLERERLTVGSNPEDVTLGVPFDYNLVYHRRAQGPWTNIQTGPAGHGYVTSFVLASCLEGTLGYKGRRPGE